MGFGPLSTYPAQHSKINTPNSNPYVNIDPSPIKMVSGPKTMIYAKRYIIDFMYKSTMTWA